jgi:hypothetical protein
MLAHGGSCGPLPRTSGHQVSRHPEVQSECRLQSRTALPATPALTGSPEPRARCGCSAVGRRAPRPTPFGTRLRLRPTDEKMLMSPFRSKSRVAMLAKEKIVHCSAVHENLAAVRVATRDGVTVTRDSVTVTQSNGVIRPFRPTSSEWIAMPILTRNGCLARGAVLRNRPTPAALNTR